MVARTTRASTITEALTTSLPEGNLHSPAGLLTHRLKTTPTPKASVPRPKPHPFRIIYHELPAP
ncbi:hypothetical protein ACFRAO_26925 [Streptomyces sp. NPDC056656]|uniref:hypothetical protein n=1 Tax=Streptomyces sp. NPDC056656 TaxID=3345895 RepID=UPI0036738750